MEGRGEIGEEGGRGEGGGREINEGEEGREKRGKGAMASLACSSQWWSSTPVHLTQFAQEDSKEEDAARRGGQNLS